jgi:hypothetical protein
MGKNELAKALENVIIQYKETFGLISRKDGALLELSAMMLAIQHYEKSNYKVKPIIPNDVKMKTKMGLKVAFEPKWGTKGIPRKHCWWEIQRDKEKYEIHMNAPVWDGISGKAGVYVVDVAVINSEAQTIPDKDYKGVSGFANNDLITFMEAKSFPIYPMLVAHFLGIVHEIKPWAMNNKTPSRFLKESHFDPTLVSRGDPKVNVGNILRSLSKRKIRVRVIHKFEVYVQNGNLSKTSKPSVLARNKSSVWMENSWW